MEQETICRKDKIELARELAEKTSRGTRKKDSLGSFFLLRCLLSFFFFLVVLGITEFDAAGEETAAVYQKKIGNALCSQQGMEKMKQEIDRLIR